MTLISFLCPLRWFGLQLPTSDALPRSAHLLRDCPDGKMPPLWSAIMEKGKLPIF